MNQITGRPCPEPIHELFKEFDAHLAVTSILDGNTPGTLYIDKPQAPQVGLCWFKHRVFLAGATNDAAIIAELGRVLTNQLLEECTSTGREAFILHALPQVWENQLAGLLPNQTPIPAQREHYLCSQLKGDWRPLVPSGFELQIVDEHLVAQPDLVRLTELQEEMTSERPSIDDFLAKSFGVCLVHQNRLVGWCLSEYNTAERCEVGVATVEAYQRRGLGTAMTLALLEQAFQRGYQAVGWHCWQRNQPSGALARRAGFTLERVEPVYLFLLEE